MTYWNYVKNFYRNYISDLDALANPTNPLYNPTAKETRNMARIEITPEGKALLLDGSNQVATYVRRRDAVRGAARRGLVLA